MSFNCTVPQYINILHITSKVTAPQDAHGRLVLQVYLGSSTLNIVYIGKIFVSRL